MSAGSKTALVTVLRETRTESSDGTGEALITWSTAGQLWVEPAPLAPRESERQGAVRETTVVRFRANAEGARAIALVHTDRITWDGRTYAVREIRWPPRRDIDVEIIADSVSGVS